MISVSDALNDIIKSYPFIEEGLSRGIINYSAFAREIKPRIETKLYKPVTEGSIVMALKRISAKLSGEKFAKNSINLTDLTVRSNLTEFTFANSASLIDKQRELFNQLTGKREVFCAISQGIRETTFITSAEIAKAVEKIFTGEILVAKIANLSSITIHLPVETVKTPGVYYQILKMLAWEKINMIEAISTYTEITIVFDSIDINKAFAVLSNFKKIS